MKRRASRRLSSGGCPSNLPACRAASRPSQVACSASRSSSSWRSSSPGSAVGPRCRTHRLPRRSPPSGPWCPPNRPIRPIRRRRSHLRRRHPNPRRHRARSPRRPRARPPSPRQTRRRGPRSGRRPSRRQSPRPSRRAKPTHDPTPEGTPRIATKSGSFGQTLTVHEIAVRVDKTSPREGSIRCVTDDPDRQGWTDVVSYEFSR